MITEDPLIQPGGSDENADAAQKHLKKVADGLAEHFDSVLIIATKRSENGECGTRRFDASAGNWYAGFGAAQLFIKNHELQEIKWGSKD